MHSSSPMQLFALWMAYAISRIHAETVLGVYIVSRHGDRTAKATPPTNLTDLGYREVFTSGNYFRSRYVQSGASSMIAGISPDEVDLSQVIISAPVDNVLMSSAIGFGQGLYPPTGPPEDMQTLRNGTVVEAPLNGYQIIPIMTVGGAAGANQENTAFLQAASNCTNAINSANEYFTTPEYLSLLASTRSFYQSLEPLYNGTFTDAQATFKNAYSIFDLLNVASIDNTTFDPGNTLTPADLFQLRTLADTHEFNLAYNNTDPVRAVAGQVLAGQVLIGLNATIASAGKLKLQAQFGAYNSFLSFFGLANLTDANPDFFGVPDYASTLTFELFTDADSATPFPPVADLNVRFLFHNGTTSAADQPVAYPLFDQPNVVLSWTDFVAGIQRFAITSQAQFCAECGNTGGSCATSAPPATFARL